MEKLIQPGDKFKNSIGKVCTIVEIESDNKVQYLHENGHTYRTSIAWIHGNWTKLYSVEKDSITEKPILIQNYAISITGTPLEDRLKVKALLMELKEPVYLMSAAFSEKVIKEKAYLYMEDHDEWALGSKSDIEGKTILTIKEFIDLFGTKQELKEPMFEVLENKSEITTKITKKETLMSKLKTTALDTLEQNKQAAIIAAKVDAGRIINK